MSLDPLETAIEAAVVRALRRRAEALRQRAAQGVDVLDCSPPVLVIESKSAHAFKIARDLDAIAAAVKAEAEA